ncbi:MAG: tyrosine-type recombinase/integrase [Bacteroidota bacterium]
MRTSSHELPPVTWKPVRLSVRTLQLHYEGFLRTLRSRKPETRGTYERALREFLRWFAHDKRCRFRIVDVERYKRHLTKRKRLSAASVSTYLTAVRLFCGYLVDVGVLEENPSSFVRGNERPRGHSRDPLTRENVKKLLGVLNGEDERGVRDSLIARLMLRCALSEIEIVRANVGDISSRNGATLLAVQGKGRSAKDEHITVPHEVLSFLDRYLVLRERAHPDDPLFVSAGKNRKGERMTTRAVRDRVNACLERAGLRKRDNRTKITPYSLRHTAAVLMADEGATAEEIRRRMRLGTVETAKLYLHQDYH